jgi:hypothetical protein
MGFSKLQVNCLIHKKSYGFYFITLKVIKNFYEHKIQPTWTFIKPLFKDIQIASNSIHVITRMQFPIQLVATHVIHQAKGLTLDHLTFDPNGVYKHCLTYTTLSHLKNNFFFKPPSTFTNENFPN